ncbi:GTP-binding protein [Pseudaeromonas paramecii]|uniref:GTP-binding protein n=1 Tax=Pseudaeromonas paramecii TaxID=2138166 RepID=A0ABP8Q0D1_9GAMM
MSTADRRIPVSLISGFLGAGKSTLLNHWLQQPQLAKAAVLINEYGPVGVDHHLVRQLDHQPVLLASGCICCTLQGSLVDSLQSLFLQALRRQVPPFDRLIIETTGLADPAGVMFTLRQSPFLAERYRYAGLLTVVDGQYGLAQLETEPEALKQAALADALLISKPDLCTEDQLQALQQRLVQINPGATCQTVAHGQAEVALLAQLCPDPASSPRRLKRWLQPATTIGLHGDGAPAHGVTSFCLTLPPQWGLADLLAALERVQNRHGAALLRLKGLVRFPGDTAPLVLQAVHGTLYPLARLAEYPPELTDNQLVFLTRNLTQAQLAESFFEC